jgi:AGCS family alanine or glycine:cation symporter
MFSDYVLFAACLFLILGSVFITFKLRFIQIRFLPALFGMLKASFFSKNDDKKYTVPPMKALVTAMSTTLGLGTIVGPVIAIHLGGPGALLGFLLTAFFGSATTFTEVNLSVKYRKKLESGQILGGPMQYLKCLLSPTAAKWYAIGCCILMTAWSGAQANQLAAILDSPLTGDYRIPTAITAVAIVLLTISTLVGGIKRVSAMSSKLVPLMFTLYLVSGLSIIFSDLDRLGEVMAQMFDSVFHPYAMASGTLVGGIVSCLRWGIFKGTQATEAGIGTQAIPHSMAETNDPVAQGTLSMLSTFTAGLLAFMSGCIVLVTDTWQNPELPLGISMVAASFQMHFSHFGLAIIAVCTILFGFGTILGNSFNGSQCYGYFTNNKKINIYYAVTGFVIFFCTVAEVKTVWALIDVVLALVAIPHMTALIMYVHRNAKEVNALSPYAADVAEPSEELTLISKG